MWRSLVACLNGVQEVPGSNPGTPTGNQLVDTRRTRLRPRKSPPLTVRGLDRQCEYRVEKRGASFHGRASKVRGREEVITDMPKKKKATKKKKH